MTPPRSTGARGLRRQLRITDRSAYRRECGAPHSRRSFDGLQALTRHAMGHDPLDGSLYVFVSRRGAQMRVLYFDRSGFCVWGKRLESGRFISDWNQVHTGEMNWTQLKLLIEGIEPGRQRKRYQQTDVRNKPCVSAPLSAAMG